MHRRSPRIRNRSGTILRPRTDTTCLAKRGGDLAQLPNWENMQNGFLYPPVPGDLATAWQDHPWGSAISAYNVKLMNGGLIELLTP